MDIATLGLATRYQDIEGANRALEKFSGAAKKAETSARRMGGGATEAARNTVAANDNATKSTKRLGGAFDAAKRNAIAFGAAAGAALAAAFSVRPIFEFRDAMAEVSTLIDTTTFDMRGLEKAALGQATAFGGGAAVQAKAFYQIISAGASTAAEATATLTAANKLAVGGVTDIRTAADGLTSVMNAYGDRVEGATAVSDAMFIAMRAGKTTIGELSGALGRVAPLAAQTGVSFDELVASVAALTKGGISTAEAMTGVRAILAAVAKPSSEAVELADQLGIKFDAAGLKAQGFAGFIEQLTDRTKGNTEQLALLFGGVEALVPIMALAGQAGDDFTGILEQMEGKAGATQEAFDKMAASPGFQAGRVWSALKTEIIGVGGALDGVLVPAMRTLADHMDNIFKLAKVAGAGMLVAFGPVILGHVVTLTTAIGVGLVGAFHALTAAMLRNPIGALAVGITVAITALWQFRDDVRQAIGVDVIGYFLQAGNAIINSFEAAYRDVVFIWKNLPTAMEVVVLEAVNSVIRGVNDMVETATAGIDGLIALLNNLPKVDIAPIGGWKPLDEFDTSDARARLSGNNAAHAASQQALMARDVLGAEDIAKGVADGMQGIDRTLDNGFGKVVSVGSQFPDSIAKTTSAVDAVRGSVDGSGDRIVGALGQQTSALTAGLARMEAQAAAANAANTSGAFGGSAGGSQAAQFSVNVAAQERVEDLARERDVLQTGIQFKQLTPEQERADQLRIAQIDLETAKLNQHMGEVSDAFQSLRPSLLSMFASGEDFQVIVDTINSDLKRKFGASGADFFSSSSIPGFAGMFADGGTIPRGQFGIVGEKGPELIRGPADVIPMGAQQASVTNNNDSSSRSDRSVHIGQIVLGGGGGGGGNRGSSRQQARDMARMIGAYN